MKEEEKDAAFCLKRNRSQDLVTRDHQLELSHGRAWTVNAKAKMPNTQLKSVFLFNFLQHPQPVNQVCKAVQSGVCFVLARFRGGKGGAVNTSEGKERAEQLEVVKHLLGTAQLGYGCRPRNVFCSRSCNNQGAKLIHT